MAAPLESMGEHQEVLKERLEVVEQLEAQHLEVEHLEVMREEFEVS